MGHFLDDMLPDNFAEFTLFMGITTISASLIKHYRNKGLSAEQAKELYLSEVQKAEERYRERERDLINRLQEKIISSDVAAKIKTLKG